MLPVLPSHALLDSSSTASQRGANKRASSVIFRIEHLLPTSATPVSVSQSSLTTRALPLTTSSPPSAAASPASPSSWPHPQVATKRARQIRSGVYASQFTPKDTISESVDTAALMSTSSSVDHTFCTLSQDVLGVTPAILRNIKLSEDIHSYNVLFELLNGNVFIRVVRDLSRDEELVAWFGEEIAMLMAIPFLTPQNIQGNKRYTCHLCHLTVETPNPLKIHLALACGRHSLDMLWIRLHYAIRATSYPQQMFAMQLSAQESRQHSPVQPIATTSSIPSTATLQPPPTSISQRFSAFKPITSSAVTVISTAPSTFSLPILHTTTTMASNSALTFLPTLTSATIPLPTVSLMQTSGANPLNAAAQIEAIVSNMGASKQGHLCIYCGKVYSRKYGLKIHIRTHTGFKPLKCKFCLRPFGDPSNLNKHVRLHLQTSTNSAAIEGYKCHLCQKTLARRRDLQRHIESRHT